MRGWGQGRGGFGGGFDFSDALDDEAAHLGHPDCPLRGDRIGHGGRFRHRPFDFCIHADRARRVALNKYLRIKYYWSKSSKSPKSVSDENRR